jgi:hypothetical protein
MKKLLIALSMVVVIGAHSLSLAQSAEEDVTLSEVQAAMIDHMNLIGRSDIVAQMEDLDYDSWMVIYDSMPTKLMYLNAVGSMRQRAIESGSSLTPGISAVSPGISAVSPALLFSPAYPSGTDYLAYTATLPGLSLLFDSPDIGTETGTSLTDERCDAHGEGGLRIATHVLVFVTIATDATCAGVGTFACIPYGIAAAASYASEIVLQQCNYQTALVDSAEIEAAFENTVGIIRTSNNIDTVINNETNFTSDAELAVLQNQLTTHDTTIKNNLSTHDTTIKSNLSTHDTDIKVQLSTHDADVKSLLVALQGAVDVLLARQLEVLRLLHTPQGQRSTIVPACEGAGCDFPDK